MSRFSAIDLSQIAPPDLIEPLDYETILQALKDDFVARCAALGVDYDVANLESDPAIKVLEVAAYRELVLRALVNDKARAVLLAVAQGADLDHLGVYYATERLVVTPATENAAAVMESDIAYRGRIALAPEAFSSAGPEGAYAYYARAADASIKSVGVYAYADGLSAGEVQVYLLTTLGDGTADQTLIDKVTDALKNGEKAKRDKIPATDVLSVLSAVPVPYAVTVRLDIPKGPDPLLLKIKAEAALAAYTAGRHMVGAAIRLSGLTRAAQVDGVETVVFTSPAADIIPARGEAPYCTAITVTTQTI